MQIDKRTELENAGYKVTTCLSGNYIAKKGQRVYSAESLSELYSKILG